MERDKRSRGGTEQIVTCHLSFVKIRNITWKTIGIGNYIYSLFSDTMDLAVVKGKPLSKEETKALLELIESSEVITTKATNASNNKLKKEEWIRLTDRFNATATTSHRTPQQLRLKWENLKKNSRKRSTKIRMNHIKTGGGAPDYVPPDEVLDRVTSLLGSTANGFSVPFGGDSESEAFVVGGVDDNGGKSDDNSLCLEDPVISAQSHIIATDCGIPNTQVVNVTSSEPKRLTFSTPRIGKKKFKKIEESKVSKNLAIAEYFTAKKECLNEKVNNILLQNENLKLENEKLRMELENLKKSKWYRLFKKPLYIK